MNYAAAIVNPYQIGSPALHRPYAVADDSGILLADEGGKFQFYLPFERVEEVRFRDESGLFVRLLTGEIFYLEVPDRAEWLASGLLPAKRRRETRIAGFESRVRPCRG